MGIQRNVVTSYQVICDKCGISKIISRDDYYYPRQSVSLKTWVFKERTRETTDAERDNGAPIYVDDKDEVICPSCWKLYFKDYRKKVKQKK